MLLQSEKMNIHLDYRNGCKDSYYFFVYLFYYNMFLSRPYFEVVAKQKKSN